MIKNQYLKTAALTLTTLGMGLSAYASSIRFEINQPLKWDLKSQLNAIRSDCIKEHFMAPLWKAAYKSDFSGSAADKQTYIVNEDTVIGEEGGVSKAVAKRIWLHLFAETGSSDLMIFEAAQDEFHSSNPSPDAANVRGYMSFVFSKGAAFPMMMVSSEGEGQESRSIVEVTGSEESNVNLYESNSKMLSQDKTVDFGAIKSCFEKGIRGLGK